MGHIIRKNKHFEYQQDNGQTTAWFDNLEEKKELTHKEDPLYKKIFYILISIGIIFLSLVFALVH